MARHSCRSVWRKRRRARLNVAKVTIKSRQGRTCADDSLINSDTVRPTKEILSIIHEFAAQSGSLASWFHPEQTQVAAIPANFDINAAGKARRILGDQEFPLFHVLTNTAGIDAIAFDERQLDAERNIDQRGEGLDVRALCASNVHAFQG